MKYLWFGGLSAILLACDTAPPTNRQILSATEIQLTEELRVGGIDGPEEYTFGSVTTLAPAPDGSVVVADGQVPVIRRYDAAGQFIADVGRRGEGPGEYLSLDGLAALEDGRLVVWDGRLRRLSFFGANGIYTESASIPVGMGGWRGFVWSPQGDLFIRAIPETGFVETPDGTPADWSRVTLDGDIERLAPVPIEERIGPRYVLAGRGGYYYPFVTATLSAMSPDGSLYRVRNDEYAIYHVHPDGTETVIRRDEPRVRLRSEEKAEWEARSESFAQRTPDRRSDFFPIPEVKPFIRELVVDIDGRLWVSRYTEAEFMEYSESEAADRREQNLPSYQWRDLLRWDVFSPDDRYIGSVTLPFKTSFLTAADDILWGVQAGDFREDYVVRWRMAGLERR